MPKYFKFKYHKIYLFFFFFFTSTVNDIKIHRTVTLSHIISIQSPSDSLIAANPLPLPQLHSGHLICAPAQVTVSLGYRSASASSELQGRCLHTLTESRQLTSTVAALVFHLRQQGSRTTMSPPCRSISQRPNFCQSSMCLPIVRNPLFFRESFKNIEQKESKSVPQCCGLSIYLCQK